MPALLGRLQVLVAVATALCVVPALQGEFVWDDHGLVEDNARLDGSWPELTRSELFPELDASLARYYRPLMLSSFWLTRRLFGPGPFGFHAVNAVLYVALVWLSFGWLARRAPGLERPEHAALVAGLALLCALHPSRPQAYAWISGSADLYAALFVLCGLWFAQRPTRGWRSEVAAGIAFALAFLSKEVAVLAPGLVVIDRWAAIPRPAPPGSWPQRGALWAPLVAAVALRSLVLGGAPAGPAFDLPTLLTRVTYSLGFAVQASLWPTNPRHQLNLDPNQLLDDVAEHGGVLALGALAALALLALCARTVGQPRLRPWLADCAYFILPLAPALNAIPIGRGMTVSERYLLLPLLGLSALAARGLAGLDTRGTRAVAVAIWLAAAGAGVLGLREVAYLRSDRTLREHFFRQDPREMSTIDSLIRLRLRDGEPLAAQALSEYRVALIFEVQANTDGAIAQGQRALALASHATLLSRLTPDEDQAVLLRLREVFDALDDPTRSRAVLRVGSENRVVELTAEARQALRAAEEAVDVRAERVLLHLRTKDLEGARAMLERWAVVAPNDPDLRALQALLRRASP